MPSAKLLIGLLLVISALLSACSSPGKETADVLVQNSIIYYSLQKAGVSESLVDVSRERVLIRMQLSPTFNQERVTIFAFLIAVQAAPETEYILLQIVEEDKIKKEIRANTAKVKELLENKISLNDFERELQISEKS